MDQEWHERWVAALTELELDVDQAEAALRGDHLPAPRTGWEPPVDLGPVPAPLRQRAEALLTRQLEVTRQVTEAVNLGRRHARAVRSMRATGPARPVYIDAAG